MYEIQPGITIMLDHVMSISEKDSNDPNVSVIYMSSGFRYFVSREDGKLVRAAVAKWLDR